MGRPKPAKTPPKALPQPTVAALLAALEADRDSPRATTWFERGPYPMLPTPRPKASKTTGR